MMTPKQAEQWGRETARIAQQMGSKPGRFDLSGLETGALFWGCMQCFHRCAPGDGPKPFSESYADHGGEYQVSGMTGCPSCGSALKVFEATGEGTGTRLVSSQDDLAASGFTSGLAKGSVMRSLEEVGK